MTKQITKEEKIRALIQHYQVQLEQKGFFGANGENETDTGAVKAAANAHFMRLLDGGLPTQKLSSYLIMDLHRQGEQTPFQLLLEFCYDPQEVTIRPVSLEVRQNNKRVYAMSLANGKLPSMDTVLMLTNTAIQLKEKAQFRSSPRKGHKP